MAAMVSSARGRQRVLHLAEPGCAGARVWLGVRSGLGVIMGARQAAGNAMQRIEERPAIRAQRIASAAPRARSHRRRDACTASSAPAQRRSPGHNRPPGWPSQKSSSAAHPSYDAAAARGVVAWGWGPPGTRRQRVSGAWKLPAVTAQRALCNAKAKLRCSDRADRLCGRLVGPAHPGYAS